MPTAIRNRRKQARPASYNRRLKGVSRSWHADLAVRLNKACGGFTYSQIAEHTGGHPENVRRHMNNGRVSARFLWAFCQAFEVDPRWLLSGKGIMKSGKRG